MKICPKCQTQFPNEAKFCGNCGTPLEVPKPKEELKYCPQCGKEIIKGSKFCVACGAQLPIGEQPLPTIKPPVEIVPAPPIYAERETKPLAKKYDDYGIICGILALLLFIPIGVLGLYYGLRARNLDKTKTWGIATSTLGIFLGAFFSIAITLVFFPYLLIIDFIELVITVALVLVVVLVVPSKYPKRW